MYKAIGIYRTQADLDKNINYPGARLGGLIFADLNNDGKIDGNDVSRQTFPGILKQSSEFVQVLTIPVLILK